METISNILKEKYPTLPADLKNAVDSLITKGTLASLFSKYAIPADQQSSITTEIFLVLLGIADRYKFVDNISEQTGLQGQNIDSFEDEIVATVFIPCAASIEKVAKEAGEADTEDVPVPAIPADHAPETDTDHMLDAGFASPTEVAQASKTPIPAAAPITLTADGEKIENPFRFDPQPVPQPAPEVKTISQAYPQSTQTLENDMRQDPIIAQKLAGTSTLPKKETRIVAPSATPVPPRSAGTDPYREPPTA